MKPKSDNLPAWVKLQRAYEKSDAGKAAAKAAKARRDKLDAGVKAHRAAHADADSDEA